MASKPIIPDQFFFIFDFYLMKESKEDNDLLPEAIIYFYPTDDKIKKQKLLECGEIVGVVQYFQHDLFRSIIRTLHFQNILVVHEHYGRHSCFLRLPTDRYTPEDASIRLKHILSLFNMLYGTWNHIYSTYEKDGKINDFLDQALTPIVKYVFNRSQSMSHLFSIIEYAPLKNGNQRAYLESKHFLDYLKSKHGLKNGLIGYDDRVLYSTWDSDTSFYLQLIFQLKKDLPEKLIDIQWESEFKLKNGVSLFRIHIPQLSNSTSSQNITDTITTTTTKTVIPCTTASPKITSPMNIFAGLSYTSDDSSSLKNRFSCELSPSIDAKKRRGMILLTDPSGSSEETGFETDTMDEISSSDVADSISVSSGSLSTKQNINSTRKLKEDGDFLSLPSWFDESITDDDKIKNLRSRSSTLSNDIETTIKIDCINDLTDTIDQLHIEQIPTYVDDYDDESISAEYSVIRRTSSDSSYNRSISITNNPDLNTETFHRNDRATVRVSWSDIPDKNIENERNEFVLYVQKNSRMMFAGVIERNLLNDEYLKTLWSLMLSQMANMETDIQAISTTNEIIRYSTDVKFQFNENTHLAEFERGSDGTRYYRKMPAEESTSMALFARSELNRKPERKVIGLSRGSHVVSVDRRLPDRMTYACRKFQENL